MVAGEGGMRDYVKKCIKLEKNGKISLSLGLVRYDVEVIKRLKTRVI